MFVKFILHYFAVPKMSIIILKNDTYKLQKCDLKLYYPNFIYNKMTIKERLTNLLDVTQPFGYELKMVKAQLSAKMEELGEPMALSTIDRYLNLDQLEVGKLSLNFMKALFEVTKLELSYDDYTNEMDSHLTGKKKLSTSEKVVA